MTIDRSEPGWYPNQHGQTQWWDGQTWGQYAPVLVRKNKDVGIAYLFAILLGGVSAHRFYLGRIATAIIFNLIWWGGWLLTPFIIGIPLVVAAGIWWVVDLFLIPTIAREVNGTQ